MEARRGHQRVSRKDAKIAKFVGWAKRSVATSGHADRTAGNYVAIRTFRRYIVGNVIGLPTPERTGKAHQGQQTPERIDYAIGETSVGRVLVARSAHGVCAVLLGDEVEHLRGELRGRFPRAVLAEGDDAMSAMAAEVVAFLESPRGGLDVPLDLRGTAFQRVVWDALLEVAPGETVSYTEIAKRIGRPDAVRAVAGAIAANPLAVVVPCHRVIRGDGSLSGYRWGVERKQRLLAREAAGSGWRP
jgi:AraC family transcriptional regulator of adaptative response/methylated-DNA-[protein]-cysteine methyltransferase